MALAFVMVRLNTAVKQSKLSHTLFCVMRGVIMVNIMVNIGYEIIRTDMMIDWIMIVSICASII